MITFDRFFALAELSSDQARVFLTKNLRYPMPHGCCHCGLIETYEYKKEQRRAYTCSRMSLCSVFCTASRSFPQIENPHIK